MKLLSHDRNAFCCVRLPSRDAKLTDDIQVEPRSEGVQRFSTSISTRLDCSDTTLGTRLIQGSQFGQPRSQNCLSTAPTQSVSFSTLIGCNLNEESNLFEKF